MRLNRYRSSYESQLAPILGGDSIQARCTAGLPSRRTHRFGKVTRHRVVECLRSATRHEGLANLLGSIKPLRPLRANWENLLQPLIRH